MRFRTAHVIRLATIMVFILVGVLLFQLTQGPDSPTDPEIVEAEAGTRTVAASIEVPAPPAETQAIRGYLFDGGGTGVRLCHRRRPENPPICLGPFLDVYELDLRGLPFKRGVAFERPMRWLEEPVTIYGKVLGSALTAESIAR